MRHSLSILVFASVTVCMTSSCSDSSSTSPLRAQPDVARQGVAAYRAVDLGNIGGSTALAWRINDRGQVAGWATNASGHTHAITWTAARGMIDLGTISGGTESEAWAINEHGVVVGEIDLPNGHHRAFSWTATSGMQDLGTLGGEDAIAEGVNDAGEIVGFSTVAGGGATQGFVWTAHGGMKDAGTLNGANTRLRSITHSGAVGTGTGQGQAVLWHASTGFIGLGFLAGGSFSYGARINAREEIAGFADTDVSTHAFRWTQATGMVDLSPLSGESGNSEALDINDNGAIVGATTTLVDPEHLHAFVWSVQAGMRQLPVFTGDVDDEAYGINQAGTIVGYADTPDGVRHALLWSVRE